MLRYLTLFLVFGFASAAEPPVTVLIPSVTDKLGLSRLVELLNDHGAPLQSELQPLGRISHALKGAAPLCALLGQRLVPKETSLQWALPLFTFRVVAVSLPSVETAPARGDRIAATLNSAGFDLATELGYDIVSINSYEQAVTVLNSGHATYWVDTEAAVKWVQESFNLPLRRQAILGNEEVWLVCTTFVGAESIQRTLSAWDAAVRSGAVEKLLGELNVQSMPAP